MRELLIRYAIKYKGSYPAIRKAVREHEYVSDIPLQKAITILDEDYPAGLLQLKYPPYVLFYCGNKELLKEESIAVVGSRDACNYGINATQMLVRKLSSSYVIVSGMAKGIDAVAHWNASRSIGVLGNGLDISYPACNSDLYRHIKETGLLISEYPLTTSPRREHFPFRNRIMAALSSKVIVCQASEKSGTMLTVNEALELGRDIYVVPYRMTDREGRGCNSLIQQGANIIVL